MKVKNVLTGTVYEAGWSADHPASSYGQPVLILETGEGVDLFGFEVLDEDEEEEG